MAVRFRTNEYDDGPLDKLMKTCARNRISILEGVDVRAAAHVDKIEIFHRHVKDIFEYFKKRRVASEAKWQVDRIHTNCVFLREAHTYFVSYKLRWSPGGKESPYFNIIC